MALGSSVGGTVLGIGAAAIGRAAGAALGQVVDQRLLGSGSDAVETGRVDRFPVDRRERGSRDFAGFWPYADCGAGDLGDTVRRKQVEQWRGQGGSEPASHDDL